MKLVSAVLLTLAASFPAQADWILESKKSTMSFVSVKNGMVAETHSFKKLSGRVESGGAATLEVELASVDTLIPIRDERMREMLFDTAKFPNAEVKVQLDNGVLSQLQAGSATSIEVFGDLTLRGQTQRVSAALTVTGSNDGGVLISTEKPILIAANQFDLVTGIEALREIAGLGSITPVVPVTFTLKFKPTKTLSKTTAPSGQQNQPVL